MARDANESQLELIKKRYAMRRFNRVATVPEATLIANLRHVVEPSFFKGADVLEIGAGGSLYAQLFLSFGCRRLIGNELVEERLKLVKLDDPRFVPLPGDFLQVDIDEASFDVVFASLTFMFVIPMLDQFLSKIFRILKLGGSLVSYDPNYLCPLSVYRRFADRSGANPARLFNPFTLKRKAIKHGFAVEKLVPFTTNYPWTRGNWLLGTGFMMKAVKPSALGAEG